MIPSEEFEEVILEKKSCSDAQYTIKQATQNFNNKLPIPQEQHISHEKQHNLCKDSLNESEILLELEEVPGLKKQKSDTSYDYKINKLKSFANKIIKNNKNNLLKSELSPIKNQQQNPKSILPVQSKGQNDERISIIKFEHHDEELKELYRQLEEVENKILEKRKRLKVLNPIDENEQFEQDQQQIEIKVNQSNEENTCLICGEDTKEIIQVLNCQHGFCSDCYEQYLDDRIINAKVINIPCPQEGCSEIFPERVIENIVSFTKFKKYLRFKLQIEIANDPNKRLCPSVDCDYYVERVNSNNDFVMCKCGTYVCLKCGQLAHFYQRCQQAIDYNFIIALNKYNIKSCPKCKSNIEKNEGCNHMTCRCKYEYCWVCLQKYYNDHYKFWSPRGCAIWSNGKFKTHKVVNHPDLMRRIFFLPRLILFLFRIIMILLKLLSIALFKSFKKPFFRINKKFYRSRKPKSCFFKAIYFFFVQLFIIIIVIIIFPFYFLFYRIYKEIKRLCHKGCSY
ncbi:unnamed protein product [Paramecium primaurelia]|uniref:RBR-type E3 ubiquitin transferase n=1 Tax=Paramecium primaurelia TaxID=5886 RepID=A0A8S1PT05_PARPR|nr:unnamed protein product [Paramecium primaurelia]